MIFFIFFRGLFYFWRKSNSWRVGSFKPYSWIEHDRTVTMVYFYRHNWNKVLNSRLRNLWEKQKWSSSDFFEEKRQFFCKMTKMAICLYELEVVLRYIWLVVDSFDSIESFRRGRGIMGGWVGPKKFICSPFSRPSCHYSADVPTDAKAIPISAINAWWRKDEQTQNLSLIRHTQSISSFPSAYHHLSPKTISQTTHSAAVCPRSERTLYTGRKAPVRTPRGATVTQSKSCAQKQHYRTFITLSCNREKVAISAVQRCRGANKSH